MSSRIKHDRWAVALVFGGFVLLHAVMASAEPSKEAEEEPATVDEPGKPAASSKGALDQPAKAEEPAKTDQPAKAEQPAKTDEPAESAPAPPPFTLNQPALEAHLAYGAYTGDGFANPYGFGLGLRAGVTLPVSVYLGGLFEYYFGGSDERSNGFFDSIRSSANFVLLQAEPGYDFAFSEDLVLRPQLNLGFAYAHREDCIADVCEKQSDANLAMAPAGTLLFRQDSYVLYFGVRYSAVSTASDRSSGGGFLLTAGVGTPLERLGVRFLKNQP